ncbi:type II secretion system minor pseudopilin GspK [Sinimarinibacterium thermocellulolyticum]|uniref:Type II secretion system protein K n=1 Tax=Sinimarinibacterium thermocellulolyticum TaxID=3170016 RepID=A0ABV2AD01_9GAMM
MSRGGERGIALITAVLVVALAAMASTAILVSANIAIRRTANLQESELAWWYAAGVESWIKSVLERDLEDNAIDALTDMWAQQVDYLPVDEGFARGQVIDLQGRFNLNNLGTPDTAEYEQQLRVFVRLLGLVGAADEFQARAIAAAIRDWIDADREPTGADGAEDNDYLRLDVPYRAGNRMITSVSELLAIRGITPEIYQKLAGVVSALPQTGVPINVNTAPLPVLFALAAGPRPAIETFAAERLKKPAEDVQALFNLEGGYTAEDAPSAMMSVNSRFFMLRSEIFIGSGRVALYSFYFRPPGTAPAVYGRSIDVE